MFRSVRPYLEEAGIDDPVVCYQGAVVAEPASGRFLRHEPIPVELAKEAIAAINAEGFPVNCYVDDELYVARHTAESHAYSSFQNLTVHEVGDLVEWLEKPATKLVAVGEPTRLDVLEERMKARFDGRLYISKSLPYFLEFASPEVTRPPVWPFWRSISASPASAPWRSGTAKTTWSSWSGPATASLSRTHTSGCWRSPTSCVPPSTKRGSPR
jgi:enamine deaminase RidA (YjgF/YER057c/UK114 family)